ncbi:AAC(3) family N-acetyltransferase [Vibrio breoganii]|uniref:AAC(3) family N-acetyltransferase n=1 Tax=Vibrio breoganii TaxID=553239 RepID=UPI000C856FD7|nr:AAC(3) family N-acetyltransferase [Vibrio breoganii]PMO91531.1 hypothetical protein BCS98_11775 [Vibrio breoganii]
MIEEQKAVEMLADEWRNAGITRGDVVLLHSNIGRTLRRIKKMGIKPSPSLILDSFICAIGEEGTLLLPLFNFEFTQGVPFDLEATPSQMGAITEIGRKYKTAVRTGHPIYSFAILGNKVSLFEKIDNFSGYGADSPFAMLLELNGKIAVLDLPDQNSMTFYHYVEEMLDVPYRYHKTFSGQYTDRNKNTEERTYGLFVRDIEHKVNTHVNPMGDILWDKGLYSGEKPGIGSGLRVVKAVDVYNETSQVIKEGKAEGTLYEVR